MPGRTCTWTHLVCLLLASLPTASTATSHAHGLSPLPLFASIDPVFTPYHANGSLNLAAIPAYAAYTTDCGNGAIVLGGSTGEWPSLSADERIALLQAWRAALEALPQREPASPQPPELIFHCGDVNLQVAADLARRARGLADALLMVPPCILKPPTLQDMVASVALVAAQAPALPMFLYHYPELYVLDYPVDAFLELAATAIPSLAGVKYIDNDLSMLQSAAAVNNAQYYLFNTNGLALLGLDAGARGAITYTPMAPLYQRVVAEWRAANRTAALAAQQRLIAFNAAFSRHGGKQAARASTKLFRPGLDLGPPRPPLVGISANETEALRADLEASGFLPPFKL